MIKLFYNQYIKNLTILIVWFSYFASINTNPSKFFSYDIINQLRLIMPIILSIVYFVIYWKYFKKKSKTIFSIFFYIIFISYSLFLTSTMLPYKPPFSVGIFQNSPFNLFWPLIMFLVYLILSKFCTKEDTIMLVKFSILIIFFISVFFLISTLNTMLEKNYFHFYGIHIKAIPFAGGETAPRSTGISRMCLIVYIFLVLRYFLNKNNKNYFLLLLITFFGISTIIYQSRLINSIFLISNCFFVIFYLKKFFYDKRLIIFCLFLPVFLNIGYTVFSQGKYIPLIIGGKYIDIIKTSIIREQRVWDDQMNSKDRIFRFSSGRFSDWDKAIKVIKRSPLKGYGAQSDRFFLDGQSVHSSLLYAYLSGGIMGGIAIILIYIYSVLILLNFYFFKGRKDNHNYIMDVCALIMVIILLRSLLETSFAVFGVDFLLFTVSLLTLSKAYYTKFN